MELSNPKKKERMYLMMSMKRYRSPSRKLRKALIMSISFLDAPKPL